MPRFSQSSRSKLDTCHLSLVRVVDSAILLIDFSVIFGRRTTDEQKYLYAQGKTHLDGIVNKSRHQADPPDLSLAVDVAPWPVKWPDQPSITRAESIRRARRFDVLAGVILGVAHEQGIQLIWGGDWDRDFVYNDQRFHDLGHFELVDGQKLTESVGV